MKIFLEENAKMPERAYNSDAGLDLFSREAALIPARGEAIFDTGVHIAIPFGYAGFLKSKSGLNVKYGLTSEGVIDSSYRGSIVVKLYNNSGKDYFVNKGDKISQIVILPVDLSKLELVNDVNFLGETDRGKNGFGSTGK